jgi:hypothetical protein
MDARGETEVPLVSKRELAERIWDRVAELRGAAKGGEEGDAGRKS